MIVFTSAQLESWINAFMLPLARILAFMSAAPLFNNLSQPRNIRIAAGVIITIAVAPMLPPMPDVSPGSWQGLSIIAVQMVIGLLLGFCLRLAIVALDMAGAIIGMQMGLSFAVFFDPQSGGQSAVLSEFLGLFTILVYIAMNGHLLSLSMLINSFTLLPVAVAPLPGPALPTLLAWSAVIFTTGLLIALPIITALLIANLAMGVLARVAPQLNIFAVGFPITLMSGFVMLMFSIPYIGDALGDLFDNAFEVMSALMRGVG